MLSLIITKGLVRFLHLFETIQWLEWAEEILKESKENINTFQIVLVMMMRLMPL